MKGKMKLTMKLIVFLAVIVFIAMLILIPPITERVATLTGWTTDKIKTLAKTVVGSGLGLILVNFGVAALAVPLVGVLLIVIGLALTAYSVYPFFQKNNTGDELPKASLNKFMPSAKRV